MAAYSHYAGATVTAADARDPHEVAIRPLQPLLLVLNAAIGEIGRRTAPKRLLMASCLGAMDGRKSTSEQLHYSVRLMYVVDCIVAISEETGSKPVSTHSADAPQRRMTRKAGTRRARADHTRHALCRG